MFENIINFFKNLGKSDKKINNSKDTAKERLHLVLMQDRANVSADFLELMRQEIIEVIKKYVDIDESSIDVRMTNKQNDDGTSGAPALYANIPIMNIRNDVIAEVKKETKEEAEGEKKEEVENNKEKEDEKKDVETNEEVKEDITKDENEPEEKKEETVTSQN